MFIGNIANDESSVNVGNVRINNQSNQDKQVSKQKDGVINAANLNLGKHQKKQSLVEEKKAYFKKQALHTIENAKRNREKKLAILEKMQKQCEVLEQEIEEDRSYIEELSKQRVALMEEYGIEDDSEEEKELMAKESILLSKKEKGSLEEKLTERKIKQGTTDTKKEEEGLEEKLTRDFTDYQIQAFNIDKRIKEYTDSLRAKKGNLEGYQKAIIDFNIEDAKDQSMLNAYKEAEKILEEGSKAIINVAVKEAVEKKEEETKEDQEKAKEKQEKDKEEQEIKDKQQEQNINNETRHQEDHTQIMKEISQMASEQEQKKLLKMAQDSNLYDEDIKGIAVDEQI